MCESMIPNVMMIAVYPGSKNVPIILNKWLSQPKFCRNLTSGINKYCPIPKIETTKDIIINLLKNHSFLMPLLIKFQTYTKNNK